MANAKMKKKLEMNNEIDYSSKRMKGSRAEDEAIGRLLNWWFCGSDFNSDEFKRVETYSESARSRWFANGQGI